MVLDRLPRRIQLTQQQKIDFSNICDRLHLNEPYKNEILNNTDEWIEILEEESYELPSEILFERLYMTRILHDIISYTPR